MSGVEESAVEHRYVTWRRPGDTCPQIFHPASTLGRAVRAPELSAGAGVAATTRSFTPSTSPRYPQSRGRIMLRVLLVGDADDASEIRGRVTDVVVVDAWSVGIPATGVLVGAGAADVKEGVRG